MTEHPLLCNAQVVRNILARWQTQDRRPMKSQLAWEPEGKVSLREVDGLWRVFVDGKMCATPTWKSPFGKPGDVLVVKEGYRIKSSRSVSGTETVRGIYLADDIRFIATLTAHEAELWNKRKKPFGRTPSRFMYKSLCRLRLLVKRVWVEQVQSISEADAKAEGISVLPLQDASDDSAWWQSGPGLNQARTPKASFKALWESLCPGSWNRNDWLWCCEFEEYPK